jgi:chromosome segregation ATPase
MFTGHGPMVPQFAIPAAPSTMDFSQTNLTDARTLFPEDSKLPARAHGPAYIEFLMKAPESAERNSLLNRFALLSRDIETFLSQSKAARAAELEEKRADLWKQCRAIEDEIKAHTLEIGRLTAQLNANSTELSGWRQRSREADAAPHHTRYPNESEVREWNQRKNAAREGLASVEQNQTNLGTWLQSFEAQKHKASRRLAELNDELRAVDSELNELGK